MGQLGQPGANHDLGAFLGKTSNINLAQNVIINMIKVIWKTRCTYMHWSHITITYSKSITHGIHKIICDHDMVLMNEHDDAYVDTMLMVIVQANTRSVTALLLTKISSRDLKDVPFFIE